MSPRVRWISDRIGDGAGDGAGGGPVRRSRLLLMCDYRPHEAATVIDHIDAIRRWSRSDVFVMPIFGDLPDESGPRELRRHRDALQRDHVERGLPVAARSLAGEPVQRRQGSVRPGRVPIRRLDGGRDAQLGIEVLFTCVPEDQVRTGVSRTSLPQMKRKVTVLTGYVPEELLALPLVPYQDRTIDVGYRGRRLPAWLGSLAQEKGVIADRFLADAPSYGLTTDISTSESDRLYGDAWIRFVASSKATLGVESGASVFDFDGSIEQAIRNHLAAHPDASFEELHRLFLAEVDGKIRLNQISPRSFEAAALGHPDGALPRRLLRHPEAGTALCAPGEGSFEHGRGGSRDPGPVDLGAHHGAGSCRGGPGPPLLVCGDGGDGR